MIHSACRSQQKIYKMTWFLCHWGGFLFLLVPCLVFPIFLFLRHFVLWWTFWGLELLSVLGCWVCCVSGLSYLNSTHTLTTHRLCWRSTLISFTHLHLSLQRTFFLVDFATDTCAFLVSLVRSFIPSHPSWFKHPNYVWSWDSHGGEYEDCCLLDCCDVWSDRKLPAFQRCLLPPSGSPETSINVCDVTRRNMLRHSTSF
jgi:hypothetical protein